MIPDPRDAERIASAIGPLHLNRVRARQSRNTGSHPRRTAGPGSEFWQFRTLEPGEPADKVDWRRSARSDELYVRLREREDPAHLWLWTDGSQSMAYASDASLRTKAAYAATLVAAIGLAAHEAGETCCRPPDARALSPLGVVSAEGNGRVPRFPALGDADVIVAAGDFLDDDGLDWLRDAARSGASGVVIAVQDPAEIGFPFSGRVRFEAVEDGDVDCEVGHAERLRERYQAAWSAHRTRLAAATSAPHWLLVEAPTNTSIDDNAFRIASWLRDTG